MKRDRQRQAKQTLDSNARSLSVDRSPGRRRFDFFKSDHLISYLHNRLRRPDLRLIEDLRRLPHDQKRVDRTYLRVDGRPAEYRYRPELARRMWWMQSQMRLGFQDPKKVTVCQRRSLRRRVIFALRKAGRGGQKPARWTDKSYIRCK